MRSLLVNAEPKELRLLEPKSCFGWTKRNLIFPADPQEDDEIVVQLINGICIPNPIIYIVALTSSLQPLLGKAPVLQCHCCAGRTAGS
jgi:hypothetical protein